MIEREPVAAEHIFKLLDQADVPNVALLRSEFTGMLGVMSTQLLSFPFKVIIRPKDLPDLLGSGPWSGEVTREEAAFIAWQLNQTEDR